MFIDSLLERWSPSTAANRYRALQSFFNFLVDEEEIEISPMSGISNVRYWLKAHGYDATDEGLCAYVFEAAKKCDHTFTTDEVCALCAAYSASRAPVAGAL